MNAKSVVFLAFVSCLILSCGRTKTESPTPYENPSAEGFDLTHSDPAAVELADSVMSAMGGRKNWDQTRFLSWSASGLRNIIWDRQLDRVRIESVADSTIYLFNTKTLEGKIKVKEQELTAADSVEKKLEKAKSIFINDAYWLVMPFKLKDPGVNLKYLGAEKDSLGHDCWLLELTFNGVGVTPENKYHVYVDRKTYLVSEFDFYNKYTDEKPEFRDPWLNYQPYGNILIADDRGNDGKLTDIAVMDKAPVGTFEY